MNDKEQNQLVDEMNKLSSNEKVIALYSAYSREELERNTMLIEAEEKGFEQGREEGRQEGIEQVIKKMYQNQMNTKEIAKILNMTEDEIVKIIEE